MITYLTLTNYGYIEFAKVAIERFNSRIDGRLIVGCLDSIVFGELLQYESDKIQILPMHTNKPDFADFGSNDFNKIMYYKLALIISTLKSVKILYYFDIDVIFFRDPAFTVHRKLKDADIVFQSDSPMEHWPDQNGNYVCAGNFAAKNNEKTIALFEAVRDKLTDKQNDQEALFYYLEEYGKLVSDYPHCKIATFDRTLFQNGYDAFRAEIPLYTNQDKVCVHLNHMVGKEAKMDALKKLLALGNYLYI